MDFLEYVGMGGVFCLDYFPRLTYNVVITGKEVTKGDFVIEKMYISSHPVKELYGDDIILFEGYRAITWMQLHVLCKCMQSPSQAKSMFLFHELIDLLTVEKFLDESATFEFSKDWNICWCNDE